LCITDGSGINEHIGAAVILLSPDSLSSPLLRKRIRYVGREAKSTVYAAQLEGILLALQILKTNRNPNPDRKKAAIFTDN
jgi:hypothetical protein